MNQQHDELAVEDKPRLRQEAFERRRRLPGPEREQVSQVIMDRMLELPECQAAANVLFYVDARTEVRTRGAIGRLLDEGRSVVVPFCQDSRLELFQLQDLDELRVGRFGILEPASELRERAERRARLADVQLVVVPGLAFDPRGARLGHGHGFYDRLLGGAPPQTCLVAPAFQCQMFDCLPTDPHDVFMNWVVTEQRIYRGRRR